MPANGKIPVVQRILFGFALLLHAIVLAVALLRHSFLIDDSIQYLTLAENLLDFGVFSQSYAEPVVSDAQRAPGYPVFLILLGRWPVLVLFVQHLLVFASGWLLFKIVAKGWEAEKARWVALVYLVQPYPALFASLYLAETLFILLLLGAVYCWQRFEKGKQTGFAAGIFACAGLAAYAKPVALPLMLVFILFAVYVSIRENKNVAATVLLAMGLPALLLGPWMMRNEAVSGKFTFSVMGDMGLVHGRLGGLQAMAEGKDFREHHLYMAGDSLAALEFGLADLRQYPAGKENHETVVFHPGTAGLTFGHFVRHPLDAALYQGKTTLQMLAGVGYGWANLVLGGKAMAVVFGGMQGLFNLLMYAALLFALFRIRKWTALQWLCFALVALTLLASAAAWADGRYRMIIDPLLLVFLAFAWQHARRPGASSP